MTPGFVIDLLDRDQRRTLGQDRVQRRFVDQAVAIDRNDLRRRPHRMARRSACSVAPCARPGDPRPRRGDLDRFAGAAGEDDVMPPAQHFGDRRARLLEQGPRAAPFGMRRARIGPGVHRRAPSRRAPREGPAWSPHGRDRCARLSIASDSCRLPDECAALYRSRRRGAPASRHHLISRATHPCPK